VACLADELSHDVIRYAFLVEIARLVAGCLLPDQDQAGRGTVFRSFTAGLQTMGEQRRFGVDSPHVAWRVVLRRHRALGGCHARTRCSRLGGAAKLHSAHLYQLLTYLAHYPRTEGCSPVGVLLYSGLGPREPLHYELDG